MKLLYDAFPYQRFAAKRATVRWVTPATVHDEQGAAFLARADIEDGPSSSRGSRARSSLA